MRTKRSHHLWSAVAEDSGKIKVVRSKMEKEYEKKKEASNLFWSLWGASLVDDDLLSTPISSGVVNRLNASVNSKQASKKIYTWDALRTAFGEVVFDIRDKVASGMQIRKASQYFDLPFSTTARILENYEDMPKTKILAAINSIKSGRRVASSQLRGLERIVTSSRRIAVDEAAKRYFEDYYGPFGKELVKEIKRRVRADLISVWLRKNGVDQAAVDYWSNYMADYGREWVSILPKKLSPVK